MRMVASHAEKGVYIVFCLQSHREIWRKVSAMGEVEDQAENKL